MVRHTPSFLQSLSRLLTLSIIIPLILMVGFLGFVMYIYFSYVRDLPDVSHITNYNPPVVSEVYSSDGLLIGEFWQEKRLLTPIDQIPEQVIDAFLASEDQRFYDHTGVDFRSIIRAFVKNLRAGKVVQGGSTITQQVARSLLLSRDRTYRRKIKEAILATEIEQKLSKDDILYLYLNQIYLGNRAYGVQAAAWNYFNKPLQELNLAEIAMIAGLPSAPAVLAPTRNPDQAKRQQKKVLERMVNAGMITEKAADAVYKQTLKIYYAPTDKQFNARYVPYFTEYIRRIVANKYGTEKLYRGGLRIETTVNYRVQVQAQNALRDGLRRIDKRQGFRGPITTLQPSEWTAFADQIHKEVTAKEKNYFFIPPPPEAINAITPLQPNKLYQAVVTETYPNHSFDVLVGHVKGHVSSADRQWVYRSIRAGWVVWVALTAGHRPAAGNDTPFVLDQEPRVEGALFSMDPRTGEVRAVVGGYDFERSEFNRATQAIRQPGSAFKPIIYSAALDKGYTPLTTITDSPVTFQVGETDFWSPQNYGRKFHGPMEFARALQKSVNVIAVKIFHDIGINYVIAYANKLGIKSEIRPYLSSSLGASDVRLDEMVTAYSVFPSLGVRHQPVAILRIVNMQGQILEEHQPAALPKHDVILSLQEEKQLNTELIAEAQGFLRATSLEVTPEEIEILYGARIPPGHVISPQTAFVMTRLMKNVVDAGTGTRARLEGWEVGGKTGTTNNETDAWFLGYTANLCTGVWVGYENKRRLGRGMTGGVVAAPIWQKYMSKALTAVEPIPLPVPEGLTVAQLNELTGGSALYNAKREALEDAGVDVPDGVTPSRASDFLFEDTEEFEDEFDVVIEKPAEL